MRILCWNVNGIRAITRNALKSPTPDANPLAAFFAAYNADIYCFQVVPSYLDERCLLPRAVPKRFCLPMEETKASSYDSLSPDLIKVPGFDSFWSFSRKKQGWSGVVTYARSGISIDATEGFGNPEFNDEGSGNGPADPRHQPIYLLLTRKNAFSGRCIMTTHSAFTLFNVYFPNAGMGGDRLDYKLRFYNAFQKKCRELLQSGQRVIVCGDVNTAHKEVDIHNPKVPIDSMQ